MSKDHEAPCVDRVSVRVPPFWPEKPALWFSELECQFNVSGITRDATKFWVVISNLENRYVIEVGDVVTNPPAEGKYERIKEELIHRLSVSQEKRIRQLLEHEVLEDRRSSQFLRHLRGLAGVSVPDDFLRSLWTGSLPPHLQVIVTAQEKMDLNSLADLANRVHDATPQPQVAAASAAPAPAYDVMVRLIFRVAELTKQVAALTTSQAAGGPYYRRRWSSRSNSRHNSRSSSPSHANTPRLCWYHWKFGVSANKSQQACTFQPPPPENR
ncbi:uncharacterized protein LOC124170542 [Ischnura elegans]|uniref:uncharacterized protein LOC124170542 n=1 Tax=Ischnura elegans TaxID=197161 RepID=UPI001ED89EB3|nr:uncharacterized protein LOC124170542 [Ischnura elegans]